jgi:TPR repeat protein
MAQQLPWLTAARRGTGTEAVPMQCLSMASAVTLELPSRSFRPRPSVGSWYRLAADQGHAAAQFNLGVCYKFGTELFSSLNLIVR